mgnify:CR=1 FL=1
MTPTQEDFDQLQRRVEELEARINRWAINGLSIADQRKAFLAPTGTNGDAPMFARSNHSH